MTIQQTKCYSSPCNSYLLAKGTTIVTSLLDMAKAMILIDEQEKLRKAQEAEAARQAEIAQREEAREAELLGIFKSHLRARLPDIDLDVEIVSRATARGEYLLRVNDLVIFFKHDKGTTTIMATEEGTTQWQNEREYWDLVGCPEQQPVDHAPQYQTKRFTLENRHSGMFDFGTIVAVIAKHPDIEFRYELIKNYLV